MRITFREWCDICNLGKVEDISHELPAAFLMAGQFMRAKIKYEGIVYIAIGSAPPNGKPYVELTALDPAEITVTRKV